MCCKMVRKITLLVWRAGVRSGQDLGLGQMGQHASAGVSEKTGQRRRRTHLLQATNTSKMHLLQATNMCKMHLSDKSQHT